MLTQTPGSTKCGRPRQYSVLFFKKRKGDGCNSDEQLAIDKLRFHETAASRIFPNGQARAGRAPGVHRLAAGAFLARNPFYKVKHQIFDGVGHDVILHRMRAFSTEATSRGAAGKKGNSIFVRDGVSLVRCRAVKFAEELIEHCGHRHH